MINFKNASVIIISTTIASASYVSYKLYKKYQWLLNMKNTPPDNNVVIHEHYMDINYNYLNNPYTIRIPYDKTKVAKQSQWFAYAVVNNKQLNITQQPGLPYLITSEDLGADKIVIYDMDDDTEQTFLKTKPGYG